MPRGLTDEEVAALEDKPQVRGLTDEEVSQLETADTTAEPNISPLQTFASEISPSGITSRIYGGIKAAPSFLSGDTEKAGRIYDRSFEQAKEALGKSQAQNPRAALLGGMVAPTIATAGIPALATIKGATGLGAAYSAIQSDAKDPLAFGKDVAIGTALSGGLGTLGKFAPKSTAAAAVGGLAGEMIAPGEGMLPGAAAGLALRGGAAAAPILAKQALSVGLGARPDAVKEYLAKGGLPKEIPQAPDIKEGIDDLLIRTKDAVRNAKESLRDKAQDIRFQQQETKQDAILKSKLATDALEKSRQKAVVDTAKDVNSAVLELKKAVTSGSQRAKDIIKSKEEIGEFTTARRAKILAILSKAQNKLRVSGKDSPARSGSAEASIENIESVKNRIRELPQHVTGSEMKNLIQGFDEDLKAFYSATPGTFAAPEGIAKSRSRKYLDLILKRQNPEYAEAMVPVAENTRLLSKSAPIFGDEQTAINKLMNLDGPRNNETKDILSGLSKFSGKDYIGAVDENLLPEKQQVLAAQNKVNEMTPRFISEQIGSAIKGSDEQKLLQSAVEEASRLRGVTPASSENFINRVTQRQNLPVEDSRVLSELEARLPGISKKLEDLRLQRAFEGGRTNGSRRVNLFSILGGAIGGATGDFMGLLAGAGAGAGAGAASDLYGPKTARSLLDAYLSAKNTPFGKGTSSILNTIDKTSGKLGASAPTVAVPAVVDKYLSPKEAQQKYLESK